ncbi:MAG: type II toxin-antitoxin system VapC family toxin [Vicinamibacterales bacterium]
MVIDASAAIEWLLQTPKGAEIEARIFREPGESPRLYAPHLLDVEVVQVLRRHVAKGLVSEARGQTALDDFLQMPLLRYPHDVLLPRVWELRQNLTAYDAVYVALAEALDMPLVTCDAHIAGTPGHRARVDVI